jgi:serine/threonine protein phosphatase PrpC
VPSGRDHQELDLGLLAGVTDRGLRHHRNEDAMALATADTADGPVALAVVCDGVSTSDRPDEASLAAAQAAVQVLLTAVRTGQDLNEASAEAARSAAEAVASLVGRSAASPSATLVAAVLTGAVATVCWLGDSRAYWLAASADEAASPDHAAARLLTRDDSMAEEMVAAGLLSPDEALASPHAHVVTRWIGADLAGSDPHVTTFEPPGPGVLLLCSDGLWNYQPEPAGLAGLALPAAQNDPLAAAVTLTRFAIEAGGRDNITAVLIPFPLTRPARPAEPAADSAARPADSTQPTHPVPPGDRPPAGPAPG